MAANLDSGGPLNDAIYEALEKLQYAGYDFGDITAFKFWLEEYIDNHPEDIVCIANIAVAYTKFLPWAVG